MTLSNFSSSLMSSNDNLWTTPVGVAAFIANVVVGLAQSGKSLMPVQALGSLLCWG